MLLYAENIIIYMIAREAELLSEPLCKAFTALRNKVRPDDSDA